MLGKGKALCLLGSSLLFLTTAIHAGFYVGAGIGPDSVDYKDVAHVFQQDNTGGLGFDVVNRSHLAGFGLFGSIFAGYGTLYKLFYLGAEINGNRSSTSSKISNYEYVHSNFVNTLITMKNSIGFTLMPGYQYSPNTLVYARAGITSSKITVDTSDESLVNTNSRRNGFRYGLGVKHDINSRFALRLDYSRINYNSVISTALPTGTTKTTSLTPIQQLVEFGIVVNFG